VSRLYFEQYVEVAAELLGEEDSCTKSLRVLLTSEAPDAIPKGMALIASLPTTQRDHILLHGKNRAIENAKVQEWLMNKVGSPTDIPPDRNIQ
jgi:hypothetical protein